MPKETITPHRHETNPGEVRAANWFPEVQVTWSREFPDVGIGLELSAGDPAAPRPNLIDYLYDGSLEQIGNKLAALLERVGRGITDDYVDSSNPDHVVVLSPELLGRMVLDAVIATGAYTGLWTYLDRRALNRMIAVEKKAGAAAFGRDEW